MRSLIAMMLLVSTGCALTHEVSLDASADTALPPGLLGTCAGSMGGPSRDCDWTLAGTFTCPAGTTLAVGCDAACGLGSCVGDSMIRVCAGSTACTSSQALAFDDDDPMCGGGLCSVVPRVPCPPSGQITVMTGPFSSGTPYTCSIAVR